LRENLTRLLLNAEIVAADVLEFNAEPFDAVLLDAPCSSTGTIRRHPDVPWLKTEADITALTEMQRKLIDRAVELTTPGGTLIYCVCSLEPEEGEQQIANLLARDQRVERIPISPAEAFEHPELINSTGELRTLPFHFPDSEPRWGGLDGFFAARLRRK
jgi:16S rRNA (cytosine967-C5)-methyltransferase